MNNKRLIGILLAVVVLLLIPLIAMQFTEEVSWTPFDFVIAGFLLLVTGLTCELVLRRVKGGRLRIVICLAILLLLFLIWIELAVGIFDTPLSGS
jgi:ABC-type Mn2+/Zn2+ transport system permease subunit